ncbi:MAG: hypothetical protein ACLGHO_05150 [Gammaproteobacteria bacterium]
MNKKHTLLVILALLSLGLVACERSTEKSPDKIPVSDGLKKTMGEFKVKTALLVNDEGQVVATDDQGKVLDRCSVKPVQKGDLKHCRGLQKGAVVEDVNHVVMIKSKINPTCWTYIDGNGRAREYCW